MEGDARQIASTAEDSANSRSLSVLWRFSSEVVGATGFEPATPCAQGRCATRLRYAPTLKNLSILSHSRARHPSKSRFRPALSQNCPKTRLSQHACSRTPPSLAVRFNFCSASRFICSVICEYFLNTFASPCRTSCVTHSSATPPALRRVA